MGCTPIRHTAQVHRAKAARLPEPAQIVILLLFSMLHPSFPMYRLSPGFILREGRKKAKNPPVTWGIRFVSPAFYQHDALDDQKKKGKYCRKWLSGNQCWGIPCRIPTWTPPSGIHTGQSPAPPGSCPAAFAAPVFFREIPSCTYFENTSVKYPEGETGSPAAVRCWVSPIT